MEDFAELIRRHQSMVFGIARNFLRNEAQAEDVAQEVFLELHRNLGRMESDQHTVNWLRQVTSRKCIDQQRRMKLRPRLALEEVGEPVAPERPRDFLLARSVEQMVASLPGKMRLAVVLRYQEEMEPGEIAESLGMTVGSTKSLLHRALSLLRAKAARSVERKAS